MGVNTAMDEILNMGGEHFMPSLSVDCVIFGFHDNQLKVLLLKLKNNGPWALPGGFIKKKENTDDAAKRVLRERTGLDDIFLQQFYVFGEPDRSEKKIHRKILKKEGLVFDDDHWLMQRFVTIGYYALVEYSFVHPVGDSFSDDCRWWHLQKIPPLMMDHNSILNKALESLRLHLNSHPVGYNLLPGKFTMPELQKLYETILGKKLDRRNFQRKIISYAILKKRKEVKKGVAHKAPYLYSFDLRKYHKALKEGLQGGW